MRFKQLMQSGAIQEVEALLAQQMPHDAPIMRAIGVPEIAALLGGTMSEAQAIERGQIATRQYAKRQFTWFRNQAPTAWPRIVDEINDSNRRYFETIFQ
jgi:tRNA dimethylallyltransferase